MAHHRLVMITGSGPGAGKSTLANRPHTEYEARNHAVRLWPEMALFEWQSLANLADRFRRRDYPGPDDLIAVFKHVLGSTDLGTTWIQDWSWIDLAEDLPWAVNDLGALEAFSRRAQAAAHYLQPLVLYLPTDIAAALNRAVLQRGQRWLARRGTFENLAASYASREQRIRQAIAAGGWPTHEIHVNSDATHAQADRRRAIHVPSDQGTPSSPQAAWGWCTYA